MAHHAEAPVIPPVRARMHRFQNRRDGTDAWRRCHDEERAQVIDRQSPYVRHGHDHTPLRHIPAPSCHDRSAGVASFRQGLHISLSVEKMAPTPCADAMTWGGRRSSTVSHPTSVMATTTPRSVIPPLRHAMTAPRAWHLFVKVCPYRFCGKDGTDALRRCHDEERAQVIDRTTPLSLMSLR
jgi:hypothetical protein